MQARHLFIPLSSQLGKLLWRNPYVAEFQLEFRLLIFIKNEKMKFSKRKGLQPQCSTESVFGFAKQSNVKGGELSALSDVQS